MEFLRKYGVAATIEVPVIKRGVVDFAVGADWTPAAGDVKISKDGGAAANITTLPTALAMGNGATWQFALSATEMQAARICITVVDAATKAVEDQQINLVTYGNASAMHEVDIDVANLPANVTQFGGTNGTFSGGRPEVNTSHVAGTAQTAGDIIGDTNDIQTRLPAALVGGRMDSSTGAMAANTLTASALAADAVAEIQAGLSTLDAAGVRSAVGLAAANLDTQLATIDDFLDTEVAAIKAKTDQLTFTVPNQVDANIESVNATTVNGAGTAGNPWGP